MNNEVNIEEKWVTSQDAPLDKLSKEQRPIH